MESIHTSPQDPQATPHQAQDEFSEGTLTNISLVNPHAIDLLLYEQKKKLSTLLPCCIRTPRQRRWIFRYIAKEKYDFRFRVGIDVNGGPQLMSETLEGYDARAWAEAGGDS